MSGAAKYGDSQVYTDADRVKAGRELALYSFHTIYIAGPTCRLCAASTTWASPSTCKSTSSRSGTRLYWLITLRSLAFLLNNEKVSLATPSFGFTSLTFMPEFWPNGYLSKTTRLPCILIYPKWFLDTNPIFIVAAGINSPIFGYP